MMFSQIKLSDYIGPVEGFEPPSVRYQLTFRIILSKFVNLQLDRVTNYTILRIYSGLFGTALNRCYCLFIISNCNRRILNLTNTIINLIVNDNIVMLVFNTIS